MTLKQLGIPTQWINWRPSPGTGYAVMKLCVHTRVITEASSELENKQSLRTETARHLGGTSGRSGTFEARVTVARYPGVPVSGYPESGDPGRIPTR
eukprot:2107586-Rhodomonas_salina.1